MPKDFQQQNDNFDESSLNAMNKAEDDELYDDMLEDDIYDEEDEELTQNRKQAMNKATSKFNLDSKNKMFVVVGLIALIGAIFIFNPFGGEGEEGESTVGGILGAFQGEEEVEEEPTSTDPVTAIKEQLAIDFPGYEIIENEDGSLTATGVMETGEEHILVYNIDGSIISEKVNGEELIANAVDNAYIDGTTNTDAVSGEAGAEDKVLDVELKEAEIPEDKVLVNKVDYEKSTISQPIQQITETLDEDGLPIVENYTEKLIIMYEKLPLKGNMPMLYSQVIETSEVIIFPITLQQYIDMEAKGSTVIEVEVTEMHGVKSYDSITLVEWK